MRYGQLTRGVSGITQKMLTETLRKLERDGIVERTIYPTVPLRVEYRLTDLGLSLLKATKPLTVWAQDNQHSVRKHRLRFDTQSRESLKF